MAKQAQQCETQSKTKTRLFNWFKLFNWKNRWTEFFKGKQEPAEPQTTNGPSECCFHLASKNSAWGQDRPFWGGEAFRKAHATTEMPWSGAHLLLGESMQRLRYGMKCLGKTEGRESWRFPFSILKTRVNTCLGPETQRPPVQIKQQENPIIQSGVLTHLQAERANN